MFRLALPVVLAAIVGLVGWGLLVGVANAERLAEIQTQVSVLIVSIKENRDSDERQVEELRKMELETREELTKLEQSFEDHVRADLNQSLRDGHGGQEK